jgi:hypothetical protein
MFFLSRINFVFVFKTLLVAHQIFTALALQIAIVGLAPGEKLAFKLCIDLDTKALFRRDSISGPKSLVSSVAGGEDTTRPYRQDYTQALMYTCIAT